MSVRILAIRWFKGLLLSFVVHCVEELVVQRIFLHKAFYYAEDFAMQRIVPHTGYRAHCVNDWFSSQLQDHVLTTWRRILKIPERLFSRTNNIIKTSLICTNSITFWEI
jgi:hypothetical protein